MNYPERICHSVIVLLTLNHKTYLLTEKRFQAFPKILTHYTNYCRIHPGLHLFLMTVRTVISVRQLNEFRYSCGKIYLYCNCLKIINLLKYVLSHISTLPILLIIRNIHINVRQYIFKLFINIAK
jgi:hypothetical protein